jgi:biopolymer transport protein ExbB
MAVFIERVTFFRRLKKIDYRLLLGSIVEKLKPKKSSTREVDLVLAGYSGPLIDMITQIVGNRSRLDSGGMLIRDASEKSISKIERFGGVVSTIATISPMLGLLGTVTGMMKSFSGLSDYGAAAQNLLAGGITEALVTTAFGLVVAIPAVTFYNYMVARMEHYIREVEFIANTLFDALSK